MDRFSEQSSADLARSFRLNCPCYRDEDGFPDVPEVVQPEKCFFCDREGGVPFLMIGDELHCSRCCEDFTDEELSHFTPAMAETCVTCDTSFTLEKGTEVPITKCASPNCPVLLCPCCPQFQCDGCGQTFCIEHVIEEQQEFECTCQRTDVDVYDASWCFSCNPRVRPRPAKFCAACLEEAETTDWGTEEITKVEPASFVVAIPNVPEWVKAGTIA